MTTFALVHGAWHGGWCFDALVAELEERGHGCVAPDLPCEDAVAGCEEYAAVVCDELGAAGDDVVVVGHSLGGLTIPLVAERRTVRGLVFLCALVPDPGRAAVEWMGDSFQPGATDAVEMDARGLSRWVDLDRAIDRLYHDCAPDEARAVAARLRGQARPPLRLPRAGGAPRVPTAAIVCDDDRILAPAALREAARDRLGVEPVVLAGGHSPMLARPGELAELLVASVRM